MNISNLKDSYFKIQLKRYLKSNPSIDKDELIYKLLTSEKERLIMSKNLTETVEEEASILNLTIRTLYRRKEEFKIY